MPNYLNDKPKTKQLVDFIRKKWTGVSWSADGERVSREFFESGERYRKASVQHVGIFPSSESTILPGKCPFVAVTSPDAGKQAYSGTSVVLFPSANGSALLTLCLGTKGLGKDAGAVGLAGHARRLAAIRNFINEEVAADSVWVKKTPSKTEMLDKATKEWIKGLPDGDSYDAMINTYGSWLYFILDVSKFDGDEKLLKALFLILDIYMLIRGEEPNKEGKEDPIFGRNVLQANYEQHMFADLKEDVIEKDLEEKHYLIIEGPPGTGKTRAAEQLKEKVRKEGGKVRTVQFHPNMTYEQFVGGIFPQSDAASQFGFKFSPKPGILMEAAREARELGPGKRFLLHIDEINRADLPRVLGEAIYLLEPNAEAGSDANGRHIDLNYDYGEAGEHDADKRPVLSIPDNLRIIGTMNSSDRSIAPIDIAIRRRFAFERLYPQLKVVCDIPEYKKAADKKPSDPLFYLFQEKTLAVDAFSELIGIFIDYASEESFKYLPGHSYFLPAADGTVKNKLRTGIIPLLKDYIDKGMVPSMVSQIENYIMTYEAKVR